GLGSRSPGRRSTCRRISVPSMTGRSASWSSQLVRRVNLGAVGPSCRRGRCRSGWSACWCGAGQPAMWRVSFPRFFGGSRPLADWFGFYGNRVDLLGVPRGFVLVWGEPAEVFLDALGVVPPVDVAEDRVLGLVAGAPGPPVDQFDLQGGPEVLHQRVVERVADRAHRGQDPVV